ncbi:condensation domain-containing protein [Lactiplantibacillus plantarum]|uniref:condensation domain-containing protein n=1 Tax=Lactiplantibacillus plantarum TaxID=1590 RepID=UPI001C1FBE26|nr:condensation domain-containing protein [Lactiplantibacillus plantarum]MBU7471922.1 hypothetical protein [Lactiplantibacillus plantarum]
MEIPMTGMQKKIILDELLHQKSGFKYTLCFCGKFHFQETVEVLKQAICDTFNNYPEIHSQVVYDGIKISLVSNKNFMPSEVESSILTAADYVPAEDSFFKDPIDIYSQQRLIQVKVLKKEDNYFLLCKVHHLIFDYYSLIELKKALSKAFESDNRKLNVNLNAYGILKEHFIDSSTKSQRTMNYYKSLLGGITYKPFSLGQQHTFQSNMTKVYIQNSNQSERSAIILYAIARSILNLTSRKVIIIGVPVPNRRKNNKHVISCFVNLLPVIINRKMIDGEYSSAILSIQEQLFENLKNGQFDFTSTFQIYSQYDVTFSYYPTYSKKLSSFEISSISKGTVTPMHFTFDDFNRLVVDTQLDDFILCREVQEKIIDIVEEKENEKV